MKPIGIAITGASGSPYALRLVEVLLAAGQNVDLMISKAALLVLATEMEVALPTNPKAQAEYLQQQFHVDTTRLRVFDREDWFSPWASGSGNTGPLVICPCSTGTLSAIAQGASDNLIERAADVALKERHTLILVVRETPYSAIHLQNMLTLANMGAVILPASPGFYHQPQSVQDMVDFVVARIIKQLGLEQDLLPPWGRNLLTK